MNLGILLIIIPTLCYAGQSAWHAGRGEWPMCVTFAGYAFANCGFLLALRHA